VGPLEVGDADGGAEGFSARPDHTPSHQATRHTARRAARASVQTVGAGAPISSIEPPTVNTGARPGRQSTIEAQPTRYTDSRATLPTTRRTATRNPESAGSDAQGIWASHQSLTAWS
jgi:hypothetical protein